MKINPTARRVKVGEFLAAAGASGATNGEIATATGLTQQKVNQITMALYVNGEVRRSRRGTKWHFRWRES